MVCVLRWWRPWENSLELLCPRVVRWSHLGDLWIATLYISSNDVPSPTYIRSILVFNVSEVDSTFPISKISMTSIVPDSLSFSNWLVSGLDQNLVDRDMLWLFERVNDRVRHIFWVKHFGTARSAKLLQCFLVRRHA